MRLFLVVLIFVLSYCREPLCFWAFCITYVSFSPEYPPVLEDLWGRNSTLFHPLISFCGFFFQIFRPTFRRIIRNKSTEQFSGLPYIYALLNCLICTWYGTPLISSNNLLVMTVNSVGAIFQLIYITIFLVHAEKEKKVVYLFKHMCGLSL